MGTKMGEVGEEEVQVTPVLKVSGGSAKPQGRSIASEEDRIKHLDENLLRFVRENVREGREGEDGA